MEKRDLKIDSLSESLMLTGKSKDGSDAKQVEGVYIDPDNTNIWRSEPYPKQLKILRKMAKRERVYNEVLDYMDGKYTLNDVYLQIQNKVCPLSVRCREFVLEHYDVDGNFIERKDEEDEEDERNISG